MGSKKWCIGQAPFRDGPNGARLFDIPPAALVEATGKQQSSAVNGRDVLWSEIDYRGKRGWVYDAYLEEYVDCFPPDEVFIAHPTPDPNDAAQYMILDGRVKYNMCGELCAAWIGGDDIETFLEKWRKVSPGYYKWALYGDSDNPTGVDALESMLIVYGYPFPLLRAQAGLTDPLIGLRITPGRMQKMLQTHYLIAGVKIDRITGRLRGEGVGHWVVLDKVTPQGISAGMVELYNSFPNRRQEYSYDEFINSAGPNLGGLWVERRRPSP